MTLQEFISTYNGKGVDFDGVYGNQCVDLMNQYLHDVCSIPNPIQVFPGATALQIYHNANKANFQKITNTPTGVPSPGDIIFWEEYPGLISSAGHVAIFISGDADQFISFDQNFPTQEDASGNGIGFAHQQNHNYVGVIGWLHPTQGTYVDAATFDQLVSKSTNYDEFVKIGYTKADQVTTRINSLQTTIDNDNTQIGELTKQVQDLTTEVQQGKDTNATITAELQKTLSSDSTAIDNGIKAEQERDQLQTDMETIAQYVQAKDYTKQSILVSIDDLKTQITTSQRNNQQSLKQFQLFLNEFIKRFIAKK